MQTISSSSANNVETMAAGMDVLKVLIFIPNQQKKLNQIEYFCTTIAISKQKRLQL